jgi:prefoldin subunit 5
MNQYIKIEDTPDLVKDINSGALLNTNVQALEAYRKRREKLNKTEQLENRITTVENTLNELKSLLLAVLAEKK